MDRSTPRLFWGNLNRLVFLVYKDYILVDSFKYRVFLWVLAQRATQH